MQGYRNSDVVGHQDELTEDRPLESPFEQMMNVLRIIAEREGAQPTIEQNLLLDEYIVNPNGTTITLDPNIDRPALVTSIIASIPSGATGTLTIGTPGTGMDRRVINITPGSPTIPQIAMVIYPADVLTLTSTNAGILSIEIMGGILRGQDWRVI